MLAVGTAPLLYYAVVSPKNNHEDAPPMTMTSSYLLGYGVVVPFWIFSPMYFIQTWGITNTVFRFIMGTIPILAFFRTLEGRFSILALWFCNEFFFFPISFFYWFSMIVSLYARKLSTVLLHPMRPSHCEHSLYIMHHPFLPSMISNRKNMLKQPLQLYSTSCFFIFEEQLSLE